MNSTEIINFYLEKRSYRKTEKQFGVTSYAINKILKENNIVIDRKLSSSINAKTTNNHNLSKKELEIINGLLLGDGGFSKSKSTYSTASLNITSKDIEYLQFLKNIFTFKTKIHSKSNKPNTLKSGRTIYGNPRYVLVSPKLVCFDDIYINWNYNRTKIISENLQLTPSTVRHWYYGDGSKSCGITISTHCFSFEEVENLVEKLNKCTNGEFYIYKQHNKEFDKIYPIIRSGKKQTMENFFTYIGKWEVDCFKYKWNKFEYLYIK